MADTPIIKIQKDYKSPPNVISEVPGTQDIREVNSENTSEVKITGAEFTWSPVITVTTNETGITKGDMRSQKVTVTEDISMDNNENGGYRVNRDNDSSLQTDKQTDRTAVTNERAETVTQHKENNQDGKTSRIPVGKFKQAAEKVKKEKEDKKMKAKPRRSSIPKLKDAKKALRRDTSLQIHPKTEDDFEKLYEDLVDNSHKDIDNKILAVKIEDTEKVESKFEELIHAYDEDVNDIQPVTRISKIPALLRKDNDRTTKIGSSTDKVKIKNTVSESELKDGGFKVTASTIKTKRFSRSSSRDLSKDVSNADVIETIDMKGKRDNEVPNIKYADMAHVPETKIDQRVDTVIKKQDFKITGDKVTTIEEFNDGEKHTIVTNTISENIEITPEETRRILRSISREVKTDTQKEIIFGDLKNNVNKTVTVEEFNDGNNTILTQTTIVDRVKVHTPVIYESIAQNISQEITTESKSFEIEQGNEVFTIKDSDSSKHITKNTLGGNVKVSTPGKSEIFTCNINREIGNLKQKDNTEITTEVIKDNGTKKVVKKTILTEIVTEGIPDIKREVHVSSNNTINDDQNMGINKAKLPTTENATKKNIIKSENIVKDNIKTGIPVFTKVTQSYSKGKIQSVEINKTIEWKPADEIRTKKYNRSVSEKVTKKELKDIGGLKYEEMTDISEVANNNDKFKVNRTTTNYNISETTQGKLDDLALKTTKVTEYEFQEQESNIEKQTFTLRNKVDMNIDQDVNKLRKVGKQICLIEFRDQKGTNTPVKAKKYSIEEKKKPVYIDAKDEKKMKVDNNSLKKEQDSDTEEVTILKGNVSRLKNKLITKENMEVLKQDTDEDLPKKKSIFSKIAIFERLESREPNPITKRQSQRQPSNKITEEIIEENPKINDEVIKVQPKRDYNDDIYKVEIGLNYEEVRYVDTPVIVEEFWKTEEGYNSTISAVNQVVAQQTLTYETPKILPGSIDNTTNKNPIEIANPRVKDIEYQTEDYNSMVTKPLPVTHPTTIEDKTIPIKNTIERDQFELPKINYEANIGKSRPGKIDLNVWKNQVKDNKTLVNKKDAIRNENLEDIAKTLPGKAFQGQTQITKALPTKFDTKATETHYEIAKPLPAYLKTKNIPSKDSNILPINIDSDKNEAKTILPNKNDDKQDKTNDISPNIATPWPDKPNNDSNYLDKTLLSELDSTSSPIVLPKILPLREISLPAKVDDVKLKPGKINLNLWKTKVLENKTLVGKTHSAKSKEIDAFRPKDKSLAVKNDTKESPESISSKLGAVNKSHPYEIIRTLPADITLITDENPGNDKSDQLVSHNVHENRNISNLSVQDKDNLKVDTNKVGISNKFPELVDEPEIKIEMIKTPSMNRIQSKLYFITNKSKIKHSTSTSIPSENYVVSDAKVNLQDVEKRQTDLYFSDDENKDQNKTNATVAEQLAFMPSVTKNHNQIKEHKPNFNNDTTGNSSDFDNANQTYIQKQFTNENEFNFNTDIAQNELPRSAYDINDNKTRKENMKRAKSLAELDLGDATEGQVRRIVGRLKSVDFVRRESVITEKISLREMPKKMSVLEKIALFEGKAQLSTTKMDITTATTTASTTKSTTQTTHTSSDEVYLQKIEELTTAKAKYGKIDKMSYITLSNGVEMPVIALGTALMDPRLIPHLIGAAIDLGYRAIDTAYIYGNEKEVGQAIRAKITDGTVRREELFIMSKLWSTNHRFDLVEEACKNSLRIMGLDYFDLYMIHNPMSLKEGPDPFPKVASVLQYSEYDYLDAWFGMEALIGKQLVRNIGVSNFNSIQIQRVLDKGNIKPVVDQVECHPYFTQQRLHSFCAARGISLSCFGTLGSKGTPAEFKSSVPPVIDDPLIKVMASGLNVSPAQLLIRYQIQNGHNVVVKSSSAAHLWDNLQALRFTLDQAQVDALHALNRNKRIFTFKGMGDTHRNYPFQIPF